MIQFKFTIPGRNLQSGSHWSICLRLVAAVGREESVIRVCYFSLLFIFKCEVTELLQIEATQRSRCILGDDTVKGEQSNCKLTINVQIGVISTYEL